MNKFIPLKKQIGRFAQRLKSTFQDGISIDPSQQVDIMGKLTPVLKNGASDLNLDCSIPDRFTEQTGVTATIFVKSGIDFIRISTSIKKQNGERPLGTILDRAHPGYALLSEGKSYLGYATLFGIQYITQYDPIKDERGNIIGALYVGIDVSNQRQFSIGARFSLCTFALVSLLCGVGIWGFGAAVTELAGQRSTDIVELRNRYIGYGILGALIVAGFFYYLLRRIVTRSVVTAMKAAQQLAAGDLSTQIHVDRRDEIGMLMQAINGISQGLAGIVGNVRHGSDQITVASRAIASGNTDLSSRTESQAGSLQQTASSMEQLTATVRQNADNAQQANQFVLSTSAIADKGGQVVSQVVEMMDSIKQSSHKITDIISAIEGIAFQTNILALNAAVEAARAGEQGRGFAVVAAEVRNLAQRSSAAAKEIKLLIDDSVVRVDAGGRLVDQAGQTMSEIITSVQQVADIMGEISAASREQSGGIEQINRVVVQMDEMTQQNAALVEQAAAAAESLHEQAEKLSNLVAVFKLV